MISYVTGMALLAIGCLMAIPVVVNLPDSWVGGVLALALLVTGVVLLRRGAVRRREPQ